MNQPSSKGDSFTVPGAVSSVYTKKRPQSDIDKICLTTEHTAFVSTTSPSTGLYMSLAAFTDSTEPKLSLTINDKSFSTNTKESSAYLPGSVFCSNLRSNFKTKTYNQGNSLP